MATLNRRLVLHQELVSILGKTNVYYQPPESIKLEYPCIIYSRSNIKSTFANNDIYKQDDSYEVIVLDKNPDSEIVDKISKFNNAKFNRHYVSNNINHDVFTIYYNKT